MLYLRCVTRFILSTWNTLFAWPMNKALALVTGLTRDTEQSALFVGTKRAAGKIIEEQGWSLQVCPIVNHRWI